MGEIRKISDHKDFRQVRSLSDNYKDHLMTAFKQVEVRDARVSEVLQEIITDLENHYDQTNYSNEQLYSDLSTRVSTCIDKLVNMSIVFDQWNSTVKYLNQMK